ncbi:hypothetical protein [Nocardia donostiensis]|uniref:DUF4232 domain-containing protein n=1 Tax=Nocardia donostiensis TaxID=1538463 RepID=A0A1W0BNT5_9NOCA|nr:hypothetical protein [Nocardia donostiensis]ONM47659.1 hypothetical protein B0T46_17390 [Nocardia donostiensis]OQS24168.1 hypothetical protein B0T44_00645 [Nocardia donostiensis]
MLEPTGPLPPEIYWRRRVFAIGALIVALALVIWLAIAVTRGGGSPGETASAAVSTSAETNKPAGATTSRSSSGAAVSSSEASDVSEPSGAPVGAGQCSDQSLAVKVTVEHPTYQLGQQPVFGIVITNISAEPCTRDMGSGLQRVSVHTLDGQRQLWSSTDCYPEGEPDVRTLERGEQAAFTVTWSGATSQPDCAGERVQVPSGAYSVVAQLGSIRSAPEPFNIA